jgi:hypothetical protein
MIDVTFKLWVIPADDTIVDLLSKNWQSAALPS